MTNMADKQAKDLDYLTPPELLDPVRAYFGGPIPLDPATFASNPTQASRIYTAEDDGLAHPWGRPDTGPGSFRSAESWGVFVNPPYGPLVQAFCAKIHEEATKGIPILALLPGGSRTETAYWQEHIFCHELKVVCFIRRRVAFIRPTTMERAKQNTYGSAFYGFNVDVDRFVAALGELGACMAMERRILGGAELELARKTAETGRPSVPWPEPGAKFCRPCWLKRELPADDTRQPEEGTCTDCGAKRAAVLGLCVACGSSGVSTSGRGCICRRGARAPAPVPAAPPNKPGFGNRSSRGIGTIDPALDGFE